MNLFIFLGSMPIDQTEIGALCAYFVSNERLKNQKNQTEYYYFFLDKKKLNEKLFVMKKNKLEIASELKF